MRRCGRGVAVLACLAIGCAGIQTSDLPPEPIALLARSSEDGKERADLLHPDRDVQLDRARRTARGVMDAGRAVDYFTGNTPSRALKRTFGRVSLLDPRSGEVTPLRVAANGARPIEWSADHRFLRFMQPVRNRPQIFEYDLEKQEVRPLKTGRQIYPFLSVGREGRLVYSEVSGSGQQLVSRIYVTRAGGLEPRPVSAGPADFDPQWSPSEEFAIFGSLEKGRTHVLSRVDPDSGEPPRIIARGRDAAFTPDGEWVVFSARTRRAWHLRRMRPDGTGKQWIGGGAVDNFDELHPAVSPDGRYVAYVSLEVGRERLRVRRLDGSGDRPLYEGGDCGNPVW